MHPLRMNCPCLLRLMIILATNWQVIVSAARTTRSLCGPLDLKATNVVATLTSPHYPDIYPSDLKCVWRISSDSGKDIVIKLDDVFIEDGETGICSSDSLSIYKNLEEKREHGLARLCGRGISKTIQTKSPTALIVFESDGSIEERGFKLQYHAGQEAGCHQTLASSSGVITSPRYPSNYPDLSDCSTLIRLPVNRQIFLSFEDLTLEFDDNCKSDYVEVFDGPNKGSTSLGRFCGLSGTTSLQSSKNVLYVVFHSDRLVNAKGFKARYSSDQVEDGSGGSCQAKHFLTNGTISSPDYPAAYGANSNCRVHISSPPGTTIVLVIEDLGIEYSSSCSKDFLEVQDGKERNSKSLGRFCGGTHNLPERVITSSSNNLMVVFRSDSTNSGKGFQTSYFIKPSSAQERPSLTPWKNDFIKFKLYPRDAVIEEGKSHTLKCAFKNGYWKWFKDNVPIDKLAGIRSIDAETLVIEKMRQELVGIYACEAYTLEGTYAAYSWISMKPKTVCPGSRTSPLPQTQALFEDDVLNLDCNTESTNSVFQWIRNGKPVIASNIVRMNKGSIQISRTAAADSGLYECLAKDQNLNCEQRFSSNVVVKPKVCGKPRIQSSFSKPEVDDQNRIVGGREAQRGTHPWQTVFYHKVAKLFFCGGSLLNNKWVLTAAHCYVRSKYRIEDTEVRLGKNHIDRDELGQFFSGIKKLIVHPGIKQIHNYYDNDIALVELNEIITFNDFISTICIVEPKIVQDEFKDGTFHKGVVTGWGELQERGEQPAVLQELVLPIQPQSKCSASTEFLITRNMFCAGYEEETVSSHIKRDACAGDSGGPLAVKLQDRWIVLGIVSWGEGCARRGKYGIYTKVDNYYNWIKNNTF